MKKLLITFFFLLIFQSAFSAEIQTKIDDYPSSFWHLRQNLSRPFIGTIEFASQPVPAKKTTVNFVLEVPQDSPWQDEKNWTIRLDFKKWQTSVLSDTIFIWPGPHKSGDTFGGSVTFVPRISGLAGITIYRDTESPLHPLYDITPGLKFSWCLNEVGELLYLGNPQFKNLNLLPMGVHFFDSDSITLYSYYNNFDYEILISPIPQIGDTFIISYDVTANTDLPFGVELLINAYGLRLVDFPKELSNPLDSGDLLQFEIAAIPTDVATGQRIILQFWKEYRTNKARPMHDIACQFQFDESGKLKFVNNQPFSTPDKYIPNNFPKIIPPKETVIVRSKNRTIERK